MKRKRPNVSSEKCAAVSLSKAETSIVFRALVWASANPDLTAKARREAERVLAKMAGAAIASGAKGGAK